MKIKYNYIFFIVATVLAFIVGSRGATPDTQIYLNIFKNIDKYPLYSLSAFYEESSIELGFGWILYTISFITNSPTILFTIISFSIFTILYLTTKKLNLNPLLILAVYISSSYFIYLQFMQIRQGISSLLALYIALNLINLSRKNCSILNIFILLALSILCISIHQSSILLLILAIFYIVSLNKNFSLRLFKLILVSIILFFSTLSSFLLELITPLSQRLMDYKISEYNYNLPIISMINIKSLMIFFIILFFMNKELYKSSSFKFLVFIFTVSFSFRLGFYDFAILGGRLASTLSIVEIFILPQIILSLRPPFKILLVPYIVMQAYISYIIQVPYLVQTYFTPFQ